jgi:hypothetical protein
VLQKGGRIVNQTAHSVATLSATSEAFGLKLGHYLAGLTGTCTTVAVLTCRHDELEDPGGKTDTATASNPNETKETRQLRLTDLSLLFFLYIEYICSRHAKIKFRHMVCHADRLRRDR